MVRPEIQGKATEDEGWETKDDEANMEKDGEIDCPEIIQTKSEKEQLRSPWKQTLIVNVWGRRVGYSYLLKRIMLLWHPKGRLELVALDNDYFLVTFLSKEDYEFVKFGGPWMVMDHYLIVKE